MEIRRVPEKLDLHFEELLVVQRQVSGDAAYENYVRRATRRSSGTPDADMPMQRNWRRGTVLTRAASPRAIPV